MGKGMSLKKVHEIDLIAFRLLIVISLSKVHLHWQILQQKTLAKTLTTLALTLLALAGATTLSITPLIITTFTITTLSLTFK
jgi:hypothetical protein